VPKGIRQQREPDGAVALAGPGPGDELVPAGFRLRPDAGARMLANATVITGGYPTRVLRLSTAGARHVAGWWSGTPVPDNPKARALARRLLDTGIAHPALDGPQPAERPEVTVVIPVRDRYAELARCLAGLAGTGQAGAGQAGAGRAEAPRVIVVDDGSDDQAAIKSAAAAAGASVLRRAVNGGPAAARNTGLAAADTPLVAFLDSDCVPGPGWLDTLLPHFTDPAVGAVAPRIVPHEAGRAWLARYEGASSTLDMGQRPSIVRPGSRVPYVPGAALVVRKDAAGAGFAEDMHVGEDVDFVWRLGASGWRVRYEPAATMGHQHRVRLRQWFARRKDYGTSAAALELRHPGAVRPLYASVWTAVAWLAAALGRPEAGVVVTGTGITLLARRLAQVTGEDWPRPAGSAAWRMAARQAGGGTLAAARPLGSAISRTWWPVALPAALAVRRLRLPLAALVLAPALLDWLDRRPPLDPARYVAARLLDDAGYSLGVWQGCVVRRTVRPLLPLLRGRDLPGRHLCAVIYAPSFMRRHLCRPRLNSAGTMMSSGDSSLMEDRPSASNVESMPPRSTSKTFFTPAEPLAASPHR
jgi:mycofactocin system glycosyltransferase